jgi:hypothetical protein
LSAPETNTDRILSLPDAAGTIQVSGNPISGTTGTFTGLVDISAAGAGQIQFPATQNASANANTLDDYEEGTWTPTLTWGGNSVGLTYAQRDGTYTRVGNIVSINFTIVLSSKGSSTGVGALSGLPFSTSFNNQSFFIYSDRVNFTGGVLAGYIASGATALLYNQVSGGNAQIGAAEFQNDSYISGFFTYRVA